MLKAKPCVYIVRTLLYRRPINFSDIQIAAISSCQPAFKSYSPQEREPCPVPPPPKPKPPKEDTLLWGTVTLMLITGGFIAMCKQTPEARDWLSVNAPWFDDIIAVIYQENMTHGEFLEQSIDNIKKAINKWNGKKIKEESPCPKEVVLKPVDNVVEDSSKVCPAPPPPPVVAQDICDVVRCVVDLTESVLKNLNAARDACRRYNDFVEQSMAQFTVQKLQQLQEEMDQRHTIVKLSIKNANSAICKLDEMSRYMDCGIQSNKERIAQLKDLYADYKDRVRLARIEFDWENDKAIVLDRHWQIVADTTKKYVEQNEDLYPGLDYYAKSMALRGDSDVLLYHTTRYINQLEDELKATSDAMTDRINRAIETVLPQSPDAKMARQWKYEVALKKRQLEMEAELTQRIEQQKVNNDKMLKSLLKKQHDRYEETLAKRLMQKEKELLGKFDSLVEEQVQVKRQEFKKELAVMAKKIKDVEVNLNGRLKAERETRRSQELWTAGASLLRACKTGAACVDINKELKAIEKASEDDQLVKSVLKSIPKSARKEGIIPESALKKDYYEMEKVALSMALVDGGGAPLPVYFLSWVQSLFLFMRISGIPQCEYEKPPKTICKDLDSYDLLQRARFWLEQGKLALAVKHVEGLSGASRAAANKWLEAAREHLEVRQAAEAVIAHAAAMGLQYI